MDLLKKLLPAVFAVLVLGAMPGAKPAMAGDPAFISFGAGPFDWNRQKDQGAEFRLEYRSDYKLWGFKPFAAVAGATSGHGFVSAGILMDIYFGKRIVMTPSFAPSFYIGGNDDLDLDYPLEFRSQLEIAYRFDDRSRLGLAVSHYSNASLGDSNPGTESATLYYSVPFSKIF